jgi:serine/threonine protein kinase
LFQFCFLALDLNFVKGAMYKLRIHLYMFCYQMTTAIAIEDVRREVKILRALNGHSNLVQFYDAFEDQENVYIVME